MSTRRLLSITRLFGLLLMTMLLAACASAPGRTTSDDPWQGVNRGIYKFNDTVDRAALKPVAKTYQKITPGWMRTAISNFYSNLSAPWTIVNDLLQGKPQLMAQDSCRFVLNTVAGLAGFIDVAGKLELSSHSEDFGQTLAVWGVPSGPYLVIPFIGPSTLRDGVGRVPDYLSQPSQNIDMSWQANTSITALDVIQTRQSLLSVEDTLNKAYDPYGIMRDAWLQRREYLIYDGNPPAADLDEPEPDSPSDEPMSDTPAEPES